MKRSLLVKGRTYWDNLHGRYVSVMSVQGGKVVVALPPFDCDDGFTYAANAVDLRYVSPQDYDLCSDLAHAARMGWFNPDIDDATGTEFICDTESGRDFRTRRASFRNRIQLFARLEAWKNMLDEVESGAEDLVVGLLMEFPHGRYAPKNGVLLGNYPPLVITEVKLLSTRRDPRIKCTSRDGFNVFFEDLTVPEKRDLLVAMGKCVSKDDRL